MRYKQTETKYKNIKLGNGTGSLYNYGCYLFSLVNGLNDHGYSFTPEGFNQFLIEKNCFIGEFNNYIDVDKLDDLLPDIFVSFKKVEPYNDVPSVTSLITSKTVCVCKVDAKAIGGAGSHFVLLTGVSGTTAIIHDPWTGVEERVTVRYGKLGNILGLRIFEIKSATINQPTNSGNMEPITDDKTRIDLGNPYGVLELSAIKSRLKDNDRDLENQKNQIAQLGRINEEIKQSYDQEIIKLTEKFNIVSETYANFLSKVAGLLGESQDVPTLIASLTALVKENSDLKKKLASVENNQPIVINNGLEKVIKFITDLVNNLKKKNGTTKKRRTG